jgi:hypothetical protein
MKLSQTIEKAKTPLMKYFQNDDNLENQIINKKISLITSKSIKFSTLLSKLVISSKLVDTTMK